MSKDGAIEHYTGTPRSGSDHSITYQFRASSGTKMYVIVTVDEFNVVNGMFINVGESGTTIHNTVNAMGRIISLSIQEIRKTKPDRLIDFILKIVGSLEGMSSDVVWMSDEFENANSIPDVIGLILLRHIEIEEEMDALHSGEEEDG